VDITSFRTEFEPFAQHKLAELLEEICKLTDQQLIGQLAETTKQLFRGGKRLRPYIAALAYQTAGGTDEQRILSIGFALELFHFFCLVHDDIIDASPERHGISTLHEQFGTNQALLVGDILASWANQCMEEAIWGLLEHDKQAVLTQFSRLRQEVIVGQILDVQVADQAHPTLSAIMEKTYLKTARYSFVHPLIIGGLAAGQDLHLLAESYGGALGLAFQLKDDLEDNDVHQATFFTYIYREEGLSLLQAKRKGERRMSEAFNKAQEIAAEFPEPFQEKWKDLVVLIKSST
jgi:geranylgeranyl diphosphate synthase type I